MTSLSPSTSPQRRRWTWLRLFRIREWYDTKLPLITSVGLLAAWAPPPTLGWIEALVRSVFFGGMLLAFGYLVNDLADARDDLAVGKRRDIHRLPRWSGWLLCVGLVLGMFGALGPRVMSWPTMGWTALSLLTAAGYSLPPTRLKERGWLGLLSASAAQRSLPALAIAAAVGRIDASIALLSVMFVLFGLRYILVHQVLDAANDRVTSTRTFVLNPKYDTTTQGLTWLGRTFVAELALLAFAPLVVFPSPLWMVWALAAWPFVAYWVKMLLIGRCVDHPIDYDRMPLRTLYLVWFPMAVSMAWITVSPTAGALGLITLFWMRRHWFTPILHALRR